ncbi:ethylmalonyl-CoA decarboxylase isoform X2 [Gouania willdenowi]|uniref:ethylmalonyl-CoA decarboxylase isoform X2 n=1 Tax=Gouania willdenowi TaxID=441366 RepID=UPI001056DD58|nr:ethylmalonyl-CoA decarboxylase isoform X2 [Gouania willdenowi]
MFLVFLGLTSQRPRICVICNLAVKRWIEMICNFLWQWFIQFIIVRDLPLCALSFEPQYCVPLSCVNGDPLRLLQRRSSSWVYSNTHGFNEEEIREKLQAFPGGSIELQKQDSGIATLTINNPARMNAFSGSMMVSLEERVTQLESWTEGKGLIVRGAAGTFCSGSDLNAVRAISNPQDGMQMCMFMQNTLTRLLRLMAPGSRIQFVHKYMGLVPGWGGAARLVSIVGSSEALKLLGGAVNVDPDHGLHIGLTDTVLKGNEESEGADGVLQQAEEWLSRYTKGAAAVIQAVKRVVLSGRELQLCEALRTEKEVFGRVWGAPANLQALANKSKHK